MNTTQAMWWAAGAALLLAVAVCAWLDRRDAANPLDGVLMFGVIVGASAVVLAMAVAVGILWLLAQLRWAS